MNICFINSLVVSSGSEACHEYHIHLLDGSPTQKLLSVGRDGISIITIQTDAIKFAFDYIIQKRVRA